VGKRDRRWRRLITILVAVSLLLGLAATGIGIEALRRTHKNNTSGSVPATMMLLPTSGTTISGTVDLAAGPINNTVTAVAFLATGGALHDAQIGSGAFSAAGWVTEWNTTNVLNGTYVISSQGYNAAGQSSRSASITLKVKNS
jgi:hypothetical protein